MVGSSSLVSGRLSVGFRFWSWCRYFVVGADIWPDRSRSGRYLARSIDSGLDLDEISLDLTKSSGFHVALCWKIKNIVGSSGLQWISRSFLSKNLWISLDFVDFMVKSGGSGFWGGNPPADPKGSGPMGGNLPETVGLIGSSGGRSVSGGSGGLSGSPGCLDTPRRITRNYLALEESHVTLMQWLILPIEGENSQITRFGKICGKLTLFQNYLAIYHFLVLEFSELEFLVSRQRGTADLKFV